MPVRFSFEFYNGYMSYNSKKGGFDEVTRVVISAKMHRVIPAPPPDSTDIEIDERFLPVYIYEEYYCKYKYGYYPNTRKKYYKIDENGNITTFKTITTFRRALQKDLEKYSIGESLIDESVREPVYLTLYPMFYPDETSLIIDTLKTMIKERSKFLSEQYKRVLSEISLCNSVIRSCEEKLAVLKKSSFDLDELDNLVEAVKPVLPEEKRREINSIYSKILELGKELLNIAEKYDSYTLKEIKDKYYVLLKEAKMLSKSKKEVVRFLSRTLHQEYVITERVLRDLIKVLKTKINPYLSDATRLYENEIEVHKRRAKKLSTKMFEYELGLNIIKSKYFKLYSSEIARRIIKSEGCVSTTKDREVAVCQAEA